MGEEDNCREGMKVRVGKKLFFLTFVKGQILLYSVWNLAWVMTYVAIFTVIFSLKTDQHLISL
jgi:hypothetical protein